VLLPVETSASAGASAELMLISAARAATLKLANQREAAVPHAPVLIRGGEPFKLLEARAVADPALDLANPFKGPYRADALDWREVAEAALELTRIAGGGSTICGPALSWRSRRAATGCARMRATGKSRATTYR